MEEIYKSEKNKVKMILIESMLLFSLLDSSYSADCTRFDGMWQLTNFSRSMKSCYFHSIRTSIQNSEVNFNCLLLFNIEFARLRYAFSSTKSTKANKFHRKSFNSFFSHFYHCFQGGNLFNQSYS